MPPKSAPKKLGKQPKSRGRRGGNSMEHSDYYLEWNCNSAGALAVTNSQIGFPSNRACKVLWVRLTILASSTSIVRGFQLFNSAGVVATSCSPKLFNTQKQTSVKLTMPMSEDFTLLPAAFKLLAPSPAVGGFIAVVHARLAFTPQIVFPTLAFCGQPGYQPEYADDDSFTDPTNINSLS